MKIAAIIAEYNPFHTGHKYHIEKTKEKSDAVIILMSGSFVQRGEGAIYSKFERAKAAVLNGADLVLELPFFYSTASSADFSFGALRILDSLNVVDYLSFGSECDNLSELKNLACLEESESYKMTLRGFLKSGLSFPKAKEETHKTLSLPHTSNPNDTLGIEYIKAISLLDSKIEPFCVKRTIAHDSPTVENDFSSASLLRESIAENTDVSGFIPYAFNEKPLLYDDLTKMIYMAVMNLDKDSYQVRSEADSDLISTILNTPITEDINSYLYNIKTKRYTMSRVKRTLLHILLNSGEKIPEFSPYARVLALNGKGADILNKIKDNSQTKIITKLKKEDIKENISLSFDVKATDIRSLALSEAAGKDFLVSPFYTE